MKRFIRNLIGLFGGYGHCARCFDFWNWQQEHVTPESDVSGIFVLCQSCWESLEPQARWKYYAQTYSQRRVLAYQDGKSLTDISKIDIAEARCFQHVMNGQ